MNRFFLILSILFLKSFGVNAQRSVLSAEVGAIFPVHAHISYEHRFYNGPRLSWYARLGGGASLILIADGGVGGVVSTTMLTRPNEENHFQLEMGAMGFVSDYGGMVFPHLTAGYRRQKPGGGFMFKVYGGLILQAGVGIGYSF